MELLHFVFESLEHFLGSCILLVLIGWFLVHIFHAIRGS